MPSLRPCGSRPAAEPALRARRSVAKSRNATLPSVDVDRLNPVLPDLAALDCQAHLGRCLNLLGRRTWTPRLGHHDRLRRPGWTTATAKFIGVRT